jgi:hypothetical protein
MPETLFYRVLDDILAVGIVGGFILFIYARFKKITMKEALEEIKQFLTIGEKEE